MPARIRLEDLDLSYFESRVTVDPDTGCWLWSGAKASGGYGYCGIDRRPYYAHRVAFYIKNGRWPKHACHTCDRKACCNPEHITDGTYSQNALEAYARGRRQPKAPEQMHNVRLTRESVREMRRLRREEGLTYRAIAARYGVAERTAQAACVGKTWKCVK